MSLLLSRSSFAESVHAVVVHGLASSSVVFPLLLMCLSHITPARSHTCFLPGAEMLRVHDKLRDIASQVNFILLRLHDDVEQPERITPIHRIIVAIAVEIVVASAELFRIRLQKA